MAAPKSQGFLVPAGTDPLVKRIASAVTSQSRGDMGTNLKDEGGRVWRLNAHQFTDTNGKLKSAIEFQVQSTGSAWKTIVGITEDGTVYGLGAFTGSSNFSTLGLEHQ